MPRADGVISEYRIRLDGQAATSLVIGAPRDRARLTDGTWGGWSVERVVTTGWAAVMGRTMESVTCPGAVRMRGGVWARWLPLRQHGRFPTLGGARDVPPTVPSEGSPHA